MKKTNKYIASYSYMQLSSYIVYARALVKKFLRTTKAPVEPGEVGVARDELHSPQQSYEIKYVASYTTEPNYTIYGCMYMHACTHSRRPRAQSYYRI